MSDYDSPWKEALDCYFEAFVAFFFPRAYAEIDWSRGHEALDKELQQIVREAELGRRVADKLVKVWRRDGQEAWVQIHVEVQTGEESDFGRRMYVYNYRLFDRYNRQVASFAVLADERPGWRPSGFGYDLWGCRVAIEFPIVKLLDYAANWQALETDPNPFATVVLAHLKAQETRRDAGERHAWKVRLVRGLYERGFSAEDVRRLFRFIDWVMDLPPVLEEAFWQEVYQYQEEKRMPYIPSIERIGMRKGLLKGIEVGLRLKFGPAGLQLLPELQQILDEQVLEAVLQAIETVATPDELRRIWAPGAPA